MLKLIVAVDKKWGFAKDGSIPWDYKSDMKFFSNTTEFTDNKKTQNIVLMGRKTWDSLPDKHKPLKNRINIVISKTMEADPTTDKHLVVDSIEEGLKLCMKMKVEKKVENVFVIGGYDIYLHTLNHVLLDKVYVTQINKDFSCDKVFPKDVLFKKCLHDMTYDTTCKENNTDLTFMTFVRKNCKDDYTEEEQYLKHLWHLVNKEKRMSRNGYTMSDFGYSMEFDLSKSFPLLTTKRVFMRGVFEELKMFLSGNTNSNDLNKMGVKIWDGNSSREFLDSVGLTEYKEGDIGNLYGFQWKHYGVDYEGMDKDYTGKGFDQLKYCIDLIKNDPTSRRIMMTTYDPSRAKQAPLYPCHSNIIQWYVDDDKLNCSMYQRSSDDVLGKPFNIASTGLLLHLFCIVINSDPNYKGKQLKPYKVIYYDGDKHIYETHLDGVFTQLSRVPKPFPQLVVNKKTTKFEDFMWEDIEIKNYLCHPSIKLPMSV